MTPLRDRAREIFAPEGPALDLAVLRITVAIVLAASSSVAVADHWAALPAATRVAPLGVGWVIDQIPIEPSVVRAVRVVMWSTLALGGIGLFTRTSLAIATSCAAYVLMIPQLGGAVFHDHHLLWLCALLAASPCGDALSVDAWLARRRGRPLPSRGRAHGASVRVAWILIGLVFFFRACTSSPPRASRGSRATTCATRCGGSGRRIPRCSRRGASIATRCCCECSRP